MGIRVIVESSHKKRVVVGGTCPSCDVPYLQDMLVCDVCGKDLREMWGKPYSVTCTGCGYRAYIEKDNYVLDKAFYKFKCSNPHNCGTELYVPKNSNNIEYREED